MLGLTILWFVILWGFILVGMFVVLYQVHIHLPSRMSDIRYAMIVLALLLTSIVLSIHW